METKTTTIKKSKTKQKTPEFKQWHVIFYNDDKTPFDYVTYVLKTFFSFSSDNAENTAVYIHENGKASVGIYTYEIAEQKSAETITHARNNGYPLKIEIEAI